MHAYVLQEMQNVSRSFKKHTFTTGSASKKVSYKSRRIHFRDSALVAYKSTHNRTLQATFSSKPCCAPNALLFTDNVKMNKTSQKHQLTVVPAIILRFLDTLSGDRWPSPAVLNLQQNGCSISSFPVYSRSEASGCLATRVRSQQQKQDTPVSVFCLMLQTCVFSSASMCGAFNGEHV